MFDKVHSALGYQPPPSFSSSHLLNLKIVQAPPPFLGNSPYILDRRLNPPVGRRCTLRGYKYGSAVRIQINMKDAEKTSVVKLRCQISNHYNKEVHIKVFCGVSSLPLSVKLVGYSIISAWSCGHKGLLMGKGTDPLILLRD